MQTAHGLSPAPSGQYFYTSSGEKAREGRPPPPAMINPAPTFPPLKPRPNTIFPLPYLPYMLTPQGLSLAPSALYYSTSSGKKAR